MTIYLITNIVNGKRYIGKTTKHLYNRFYRHRWLARHGSMTYLHKAMRKYGEDNFIISCIENSDREEYWIAKLNPEYNLTKGGDGGDTSASPNYRKAIKLVHAKKPRYEYASYGMKGKKTTQEAKDAIGRANSYPVMIYGVKYNSIKDAEKANPGLSIRKRIDSIHHPNCFRLRAKRKFQ